MSYRPQDTWTGTGQTLVKQHVELECFHMELRVFTSTKIEVAEEIDY